MAGVEISVVDTSTEVALDSRYEELSVVTLLLVTSPSLVSVKKEAAEEGLVSSSRDPKVEIGISLLSIPQDAFGLVEEDSVVANIFSSEMFSS